MAVAFSSLANNSPSRNGTPARGNAAGKQPVPVSPKENVTAIVQINQVVRLNIPFATPRSAAIRAYINALLLNESNQRLFVFRPGLLWTTIALEATATNPVLTAAPYFVCEKIQLRDGHPARDVVASALLGR